jgi:hypothetical protein
MFHLKPSLVLHFLLISLTVPNLLDGKTVWRDQCFNEWDPRLLTGSVFMARGLSFPTDVQKMHI